MPTSRWRWATLHFMCWERIICVLNEHNGTAEEQPVDTRNRRFPINYSMPPPANNEAEVFKGLVHDLQRAIHAVCIYDFESAKDAIRLLDINCMNLIAAAAKVRLLFRARSQPDDDWVDPWICQVQRGRDSLPHEERGIEIIYEFADAGDLGLHGRRPARLHGDDGGSGSKSGLLSSTTCSAGRQPLGPFSGL